jgi:wyosine [tRNA(Phe)-imidazoG37] synthetase (radical SAM superfamily)
MKLNDKVNQYEALIERLEKEKQEVTTVKPPPSSQVSSEVTPEDASKELAKTLSQLNFKEVEVEQLKRTVSTQEEQVDILHDQIKEREFLISEA